MRSNIEIALTKQATPAQNIGLYEQSKRTETVHNEYKPGSMAGSMLKNQKKAYEELSE